MGWFVLFVFYAMVGVLVLDMSRLLRQPRPFEAPPRPVRRRPAHPTVMAYGRMLGARSAAAR